MKRAELRAQVENVESAARDWRRTAELMGKRFKDERNRHVGTSLKLADMTRDRDTYKRRLAEVDDERRKLSAEVAKWRSVADSMGRFNAAVSDRNENQRKTIRDLKKQVRELEDRCREAEDRLVEVADIADRRSEAEPPPVKCGDVVPNPSGPGFAVVKSTFPDGRVYGFDPIPASSFPINTGMVKWFNRPGGRPS